MKALYFENNLAKIAALKAASVFSRNAAFAPFSPLRYTDVPEPRLPNTRWLKVRNRSCGLCGTDLHFMFMEMDPACFPAATPGIARKFLGHELVGEVVELGAEVSGLAVGDRVTMRIDWPSCFQMEIDPPCRSCAAGSYMLCENLGKKPLPLVDVGGGFSPCMVMHRTQPFRIPDRLDHDRALLIEPLAGAAHGVMKRLPQNGERALVIGAGTIGLLTVAAAKALAPRASVHCLARYPFQAEAAERMGANSALLEGKDIYRRIAALTGAEYHRGHFGSEILLGGFDVIYDTVGNDRSLRDALRWTRAQGDVVILGINFQPGKIDYSPIWHQEVKVTGINCHAEEEGGETSFEIAARILGDSPTPFESLITHRFPMEKIREAIRAFQHKGQSRAIKVVLDHQPARERATPA
jgi:threonine dehydrogenase-like Zn-dependent dehydrogenase